MDGRHGIVNSGTRTDPGVSTEGGCRGSNDRAYRHPGRPLSRRMERHRRCRTPGVDCRDPDRGRHLRRPGGEGGAALVKGTDFGVPEDGRLHSMTGFFDLLHRRSSADGTGWPVRPAIAIVRTMSDTPIPVVYSDDKSPYADLPKDFLPTRWPTPCRYGATGGPMCWTSRATWGRRRWTACSACPASRWTAKFSRDASSCRRSVTGQRPENGEFVVPCIDVFGPVESVRS